MFNVGWCTDDELSYHLSNMSKLCLGESVLQSTTNNISTIHDQSTRTKDYYPRLFVRHQRSLFIPGSITTISMELPQLLRNTNLWNYGHHFNHDDYDNQELDCFQSPIPRGQKRVIVICSNNTL